MNDHSEVIPVNQKKPDDALVAANSTALSTAIERIDESVGAIDLTQIWRYLYRYKGLMISITLLFLIVTYAANMMLLPVYDSYATIKISPPRSLIGQSAEIRSNVNAREFVFNQIEILKSITLAERVIDKLNLANNPEFTGRLKQRGFVSGLTGIHATLKHFLFANNKDETKTTINQEQESRKKISRKILLNNFRSKLSVNQSASKISQLVVIKFSSFDPTIAASIANAVVSAYLVIDEEEQQNEQNRTRTALDTALKDVQDKLEKSERKLTQRSRESGTGAIDLENEENLAVSKLNMLSQEYLKAQSERITLSSKYKQGSAASDHAILSSMLEDQSINAMKKQKADLMSELRRLSEIYKSGYPTIRQLDTDIKELNKSIKSMSDEHLYALETRYKASLDREFLLNKELEKQSEIVLNLKDRSIDLSLLKREFDTYNSLYAGLLERLKAFGVSSGLQLARVSVVNKATIPLNKSFPQTGKNTMAAGGIGLFIALTITAILGLIDRRIRMPEDLINIVKYPNLAVTPIIKQSELGDTKARIEILASLDPGSGYAESFRSLRTSLIYSLPNGFPQTLMITSSLPGECKTTIVTNLAFTLFKSDRRKKILLLDLDLRKPRVHKIFGIPMKPGVTDLIVNETAAITYYKTKMEGDYIIGETEGGHDAKTGEDSPGVYILPAGTFTRHPSEFIGSSEFDTLFAKFKQLFDIILIDSAPVMGLSDALILATKSDAILFAVSAEKATRDSVKSSITRLESVNAHIIGTVMSKFDAKKENYYASKYYQYYYSYEYKGTES